MKRIVICMDGTWQTLSQQKLTNIGILARSVAHKEELPDGSFIHQNVIYSHGVGSTIGALEKLDFFGGFVSGANRMLGGAFGEGLEDIIVETYLRLAFDYEDGDEIFIFGFSRGAFAARRLSGFINTAGIVSRRHADRAREGFRLYYRAPRDDAPQADKDIHAEEARAFRAAYGKGKRREDGTRCSLETPPQIAYLGIFDTVEQRGAGEVTRSFFSIKDKDRFRFKNHRVAPNVQSARHALAIDECRIGFPATQWDALEECNALAGRQAFAQRWFAGYHGDVGGGGREELSAWALKWIADGAAAAGLRFYGTYGDDASPLTEAISKGSLDARPSGVPLGRLLQPVHWPLRPRRIWPKERLRQKQRPALDDLRALFDDGVLQRASAKKTRYKPGALRPFRKAFREFGALPPPDAAE